MSAIIRLFRRRRPHRADQEASKPSEQQRFEALLRPHIETLYRMAYRWTRSQPQAEDLVQEILVRLATRVPDMEAIEQLRPWLLRILYNRYVDDYRRQRASPIDPHYQNGAESESDGDNAAPHDVFASAPDPRNPLADTELRLSLQQALDTLEPDQRDLVLLHDMEGYTTEEAAQILAIPEGTVKSRLHRARARLKLLLFDPDA